MPTPDDLRINYIRSATDKLAMLDEYWQQAVAGNLSPDAVAPLKEFAHRLAGSGGSYGFPAMGEAAHELEMGLADTDLLTADNPTVQRLYNRLKTELETLAAATP